MSSKYNRTLLTTCASVLALGLVSAPSSYAGFEWTPPEKKEVPAPIVRDVPPAVVPAPVIRAPLETEEPAPEVRVEDIEPVIKEQPMPVVVSEDAPEKAVEAIADAPEPMSKPVVQVETPQIAIPAEPVDDMPEQVVEEVAAPVVETAPAPVMPEMPAEIEDEADTVADTVPVVIDDVQEEAAQQTTDLEEALDSLPDESVPSVVRDVEPDVPDEEMIEEAVEQAIEEVPAPEDIIDATPPTQDNTLAIKPFPETDESMASGEAVVLPADEDVDIKDLQPEDVVVKDDLRVQDPSPKEDISWEIPEDFYTIEGFGSDLPLALALRQIVPAHYAFSFGSGVNPGESVSWDGGKPWNEVLADTLDTIDVQYKIDDKKVILKKKIMPSPPAIMEDKQGALDVQGNEANDEAVKIASLVTSQSKPVIEKNVKQADEAVAYADVASVVPKIQSLEEKADSESPLDNIYGKKTDDPYDGIKTSAVVPEPKPNTEPKTANAEALSGAKKK